MELKRPCANTQFPDWKLNVHREHCENRTTDSKHKQNKVNKQNVADLERNGDWRTPGASFDWFVYRTIVVGTHQSDRVNSSQMSFHSWFQMCWCSVSKQMIIFKSADVAVVLLTDCEYSIGLSISITVFQNFCNQSDIIQLTDHILTNVFQMSFMKSYRLKVIQYCYNNDHFQFSGSIDNLFPTIRRPHP